MYNSSIYRSLNKIAGIFQQHFPPLWYEQLIRYKFNSMEFCSERLNLQSIARCRTDTSKVIIAKIVTNITMAEIFTGPPISENFSQQIRLIIIILLRYTPGQEILSYLIRYTSRWQSCSKDHAVFLPVMLLVGFGKPLSYHKPIWIVKAHGRLMALQGNNG